MVAMPDQVKIKFGPARYDTPKALRRQIEDGKTETEEAVLSKVSVTTGAAATIEVVVNFYQPGTKLGSGLSDTGVLYSFTNGTGTLLAIGDRVLLLETEAGLVVISILERSGSIVGTDQPIPTVDTSFPITIGALSFALQPHYKATGVNRGSFAAHPRLGFDLAGELGFGTDFVFSIAPSGGSLNGISIDDGTNAAITAAPGLGTSTTYHIYLQPGSGGRMLYVDSTTLYYKFLASSTWSTATASKWTIDYETGYVWGVTSSTITPAFYKLGPADSAPVSLGSLGVPNNYTTGLQMFLCAGYGYLTVQQVTSSTTRTYYSKASNDTTNFTSGGTFASASWAPNQDEINHIQVDNAGNVSYTLVTSGTLKLRRLNYLGSIVDYDTGIPTTTRDGVSHKYLQSGLVAITCTIPTTLLGDINTGRYCTVLATYNYATTVYQYGDITLYSTTTGGTTGGQAAVGCVQEVVPGTIRWTYGSGGSSDANATMMSLSGL